MHSVVLNYDPWQYLTVENFLPPERWSEIKAKAESEMEAYRDREGLTPSGKWIRWIDQDILRLTFSIRRWKGSENPQKM